MKQEMQKDSRRQVSVLILIKSFLFGQRNRKKREKKYENEVEKQFPRRGRSLDRERAGKTGD